MSNTTVTETPAAKSERTGTCVYCGQGPWVSKKTGYRATLLAEYNARLGGECWSHPHCQNKRWA